MSTETTELQSENPAQKLLELASLVSMSWAAEVEQPAETREQAAKVNKAVKDALNMASDKADEAKTPVPQDQPSQGIATADAATQPTPKMARLSMSSLLAEWLHRT